MAETVSIQSEVEFEAGTSRLKGILGHPRGACGLVLFAHGSGSGRLNEHELRIVLRASHLFSEPGTLEEVARIARIWFHDRLCRDEPPP